VSFMHAQLHASAREGRGYQHSLKVVDNLLVAVVVLVVLGAAIFSLLHVAGEIEAADGEVHLRLAHPVPVPVYRVCVCERERGRVWCVRLCACPCSTYLLSSKRDR
jgi:hypothetical protein